jgi:hypothetical protein
MDTKPFTVINTQKVHEAYTRLIPRTCSHSIEEGLKAKTKDPLWFLSRQWQMGEFDIGNGGHPVKADLSFRTQKVDALNPTSSDPTGFSPLKDHSVPLEAAVEQEDMAVDPKAWDGRHLEYNFSAKTVEQTTLDVKEYYGGKLDWYDFDIATPVAAGGTSRTLTVMPAGVSFKGMPSPRFWQFEDGNVDVGDISRPNLNFLSMLFVEFAMIFSDDWFVIPVEQETGTLRIIDSLRVTDTFGKVHSINPVVDTSPLQQRWSLFTLSGAKGAPSCGAQVFYLPNTVAHALEGEPIEEVTIARDEMANMVWAVEHRYSQGSTVINRDDEESQKGNPDVPPSVRPPAYRLKSYVPLNWIPYIPRQLSQQSGQTVLRRARSDEKATTANPQYKGRLIAGSKEIFEEEVPAIPLQLKRHWKTVAFNPEQWELVQSNSTWKLARSYPKKTLSWIGRDKKPSGKQPPSLLRFDYIVEK